ncbi:hypothetical protein Taro_032448, partial [Colocasia esculenta]|nr:hypothetical protein [Colocasia esculenta]
MAKDTAGTPAAEASNASTSSSPPARTPILRYALPAVLFALGLCFQLIVLPSAFPLSHYDVLGVSQFASVEEVASAYEKLSSRWNSGLDIPTATNFIKIRYAFELLTNPFWKRDYDTFGIEEQLHYIEKLKVQYDGQNFSEVHLPLLDVSSGSLERTEGMLTTEDFTSNVGKTEIWLIQDEQCNEKELSSGDWREAEHGEVLGCQLLVAGAGRRTLLLLLE